MNDYSIGHAPYKTIRITVGDDTKITRDGNHVSGAIGKIIALEAEYNASAAAIYKRYLAMMHCTIHSD